MTVGQRIKERREQLDISAEELGKTIGMAKTTIYRYELGHIGKVPISVLEAISNALMTTPAYLMGWTNEPTIKPEKTNTNEILTDEEQKLIATYRNLPEHLRKVAYNVLMELSKSDAT